MISAYAEEARLEELNELKANVAYAKTAIERIEEELVVGRAELRRAQSRLRAFYRNNET